MWPGRRRPCNLPARRLRQCLLCQWRRLVRQGYLFGALNLLRPLLQRIIILYYLHARPEAMDKWKRGWQHNEAPTLAKMMNDLGQKHWKNIGPAITGPLNGVLHGKPESAIWTTAARGRVKFPICGQQKYPLPLTAL